MQFNGARSAWSHCMTYRNQPQIMRIRIIHKREGHFKTWQVKKKRYSVDMRESQISYWGSDYNDFKIKYSHSLAAHVCISDCGCRISVFTVACTKQTLHTRQTDRQTHTKTHSLFTFISTLCRTSRPGRRMNPFPFLPVLAKWTTQVNRQPTARGQNRWQTINIIIGSPSTCVCMPSWRRRFGVRPFCSVSEYMYGNAFVHGNVHAFHATPRHDDVNNVFVVRPCVCVYVVCCV